MYHHHPPDPSCSSNAQVHVATKVTIVTDGPGGLQFSQVVQTAPHFGSDGRYRAPTTHIYQENVPRQPRIIYTPRETWDRGSKINEEVSRPVIYTPTETSDKSSRKKADTEDSSSLGVDDEEDKIVINTFKENRLISKESTVEQILEKRDENDQVIEFCRNLRKFEDHPRDTVADIVKSLIKPVENVALDQNLDLDEESTIEIKTTVNKTRRKLAPKVFETLIDDRAKESIGVQTDDLDIQVKKCLTVENTVYETIVPRPKIRHSLKPMVTLYDEGDKATHYEFTEGGQYSDSKSKISMETTFPVESTVADEINSNQRIVERVNQPQIVHHNTGFLEKPFTYSSNETPMFPVQNLIKEPTSSRFAGLRYYDEPQHFRRRDLYTVAEISETMSTSSKKSSTLAAANDDCHASIDSERSSVSNLNKNYANDTLEEEYYQDYMQDQIASYMEDLKLKMSSSDAETLSHNSIASSTSLKAEKASLNMDDERWRSEDYNKGLGKSFDDILNANTDQKSHKKLEDRFSSSSTVWSMADDCSIDERSTLVREANLIHRRSNEQNRRAIDENSRNDSSEGKAGKYLKQTAL